MSLRRLRPLRPAVILSFVVGTWYLYLFVLSCFAFSAGVDAAACRGCSCGTEEASRDATRDIRAVLTRNVGIFLEDRCNGTPPLPSPLDLTPHRPFRRACSERCLLFGPYGVPRKRREDALYQQEAFLSCLKVTSCPLPPLPPDCFPLSCLPCVVISSLLMSAPPPPILQRTPQEYNVGIKCATITPDEQRMDGKQPINPSANQPRY